MMPFLSLISSASLINHSKPFERDKSPLSDFDLDLGFCVLKQNTLNRPFSAFARVTRAHGCLEIELV